MRSRVKDTLKRVLTTLVPCFPIRAKAQRVDSTQINKPVEDVSIKRPSLTDDFDPLPQWIFSIVQEPIWDIPEWLFSTEVVESLSVLSIDGATDGTADNSSYSHDEMCLTVAHEMAQACLVDSHLDVEERHFLGKGAFGVVIAARVGAYKYALKSIHRDTMDPLIYREIIDGESVFLGISHPNICASYFVHEYPMGAIVGMEYIGGLPMSECFSSITMTMIGGLFSALKYLNDRNVIHRDIKPDNIVVGPNETIKIIDFGFATVGTSFDVCGSPGYMAPEILGGLEYDSQSDLWSMGVVLYNGLMLKMPYDDSGSNEDILDRICEQAYLAELHAMPFNKVLMQIISCLQLDPDDRQFIF